jgi:hypothetical protein
MLSPVLLGMVDSVVGMTVAPVVLGRVDSLVGISVAPVVLGRVEGLSLPLLQPASIAAQRRKTAASRMIRFILTPPMLGLHG